LQSTPQFAARKFKLPKLETLARVDRIVEALVDGEHDLALDLAEDLAVDLRGGRA